MHTALDDLKKNISPRMREFRRTLHLIRMMPLSMISLTIIIIFFLVAIFAPFISPYNPYKINVPERVLPPSKEHLMGTDALGRDIFSRIIFGTRVSMTIGFIVILGSSSIGIIFGLVAGYLGGIVDEIIMRLTDMFLAFPGIILAMAFVSAMKPSLQSTLFALSIVSWPGYTRLVRGTVLTVKEQAFVEAARATGEGQFSIIFRHILPNVLSPIVVQLTLSLGRAIMQASTLGFIGLGVPPPTPEWGGMAAEGRTFITNQWWMSTFPGIAIFIAVMAFNLLGDGLRDALDPRLRYR